MRRLVTPVIAFLLLAAVASDAPGQQLLLNTNSCVGPISASNSCATNGGAYSLIGSAVLPVGSRPGFVATQAWVNVITQSSTLPDWWHGDACRAGAFTASADDAIGDYECPTLWDGRPAPTTTLSVVYPLWLGPNMIRFVIDSSLPESAAFDLVGDGGTITSVFKLVISRDRSIGTGSCAGCSVGACINFANLALIRTTDTPETTEHIVWHAGPHDAQMFQWQGGVCFPDPIRNRSWGMLKSLYR